MSRLKVVKFGKFWKLLHSESLRVASLLILTFSNHKLRFTFHISMAKLNRKTLQSMWYKLLWYNLLQFLLWQVIQCLKWSGRIREKSFFFAFVRENKRMSERSRKILCITLKVLVKVVKTPENRIFFYLIKIC